MAQGRGELANVTILLSRPFPDANTIKRSDKGSSLNIALWTAALEALESRLLLGDALRDGRWWNAPRRVVRENDEQSLTLQDIQQASLLLESEIIKIASKPALAAGDLPMRAILAKVLAFKAQLCSEPAFRMLFETAARGVEQGSPQVFPRISALPKKDEMERAWYKYYGQYSALLKLVTFNGDMLARLQFNNRWLEQESGVLLLLYTYTLKTRGAVERFDNLLECSQRIVRVLPGIAPFHDAMRAVRRLRHP